MTRTISWENPSRDGSGRKLAPVYAVDALELKALARRTVLVLGEDPTLDHALCLRLEQLGLRATAFAGQSIDRLLDSDPDLLILDPSSEVAVEVLARLDARPNGTRCAAVLLSDEATPGGPSLAALDIVECLRKPVGQRRIARSVIRALSRS